MKMSANVVAVVAMIINIGMLVLRVAIMVGLLIFLVKAIRTMARKPNIEVQRVRRSLAEVLKEHRMRCKMTQEFVAQSVGVSRQAVSKWESGTSEPNTSNLVALAKLYGVPADELLRSVEAGLENANDTTDH